MLYVIPIEPLEERYSAQWLEWTQRWLKQQKRAGNLKHSYRIINPRTSYKKIEHGSFLDVIGTNLYKTAQLEAILKAIKRGNVKDGDVFWFHDMWFPGLEMLAYIRDAMGIKFKIFGMLHAGTYDPHDFLTQKGMDTWGEPLETSWLRLVDGVFVATHFHRELICQKRNGFAPEKINVVSFPIYITKQMWGVGCSRPPHWTQKENIIVFPHRMDLEKQPYLGPELDKIMDRAGIPLRVVYSKELCSTKAEYYALLNKAKYAVSFAQQETWGIAMQEAVICGCFPIVPNRLSYPEMYPDMCVYNMLQDIPAMVLFCEHAPAYTDTLVGKIRNRFLAFGGMAFDVMAHLMGVTR